MVATKATGDDAEGEQTHAEQKAPTRKKPKTPRPKQETTVDDDEVAEGRSRADDDDECVSRASARSQAAQATVAAISAPRHSCRVARCLTCCFGLSRLEAMARAPDQASRRTGPAGGHQLRPGADEHRLQQRRPKLQASARRRDRRVQGHVHPVQRAASPVADRQQGHRTRGGGRFGHSIRIHE